MSKEDRKEEETLIEFAKAINQLKTDSLKTKFLSLYKTLVQRDNILEQSYNECFYSLEYDYNLQYNQINKEISSILLSTYLPIPDYWLKAIENSRFFSLNEKDKEILKYLEDIEIKHNEINKKNFSVIFHFKPNGFFDHSNIEKSYIFNKKEDTYTEYKSTEITWKSDAPNVKIITKKIKKGKTSSTITKEKKVQSFFNIFESKQEEDDEDLEEVNTGDEAEFILNDLVPFSMEYYLDLQKLSIFTSDEIKEEDE